MVRVYRSVLSTQTALYICIVFFIVATTRMLQSIEFLKKRVF